MNNEIENSVSLTKNIVAETSIDCHKINVNIFIVKGLSVNFVYEKLVF